MPHCIEPNWPAPQHIVAGTTTRLGGDSGGPYHGLNLALHVGDKAQAVETNRAQLFNHLSGIQRIHWLDQVHGTAVVKIGAEPPAVLEADASWSDSEGIACAVLTADCLPVLLCRSDGGAVAAVHAGWRGLADGVIAATVGALPGTGADYMAWLGPAISAAAFEVGPEVQTRFVHAMGEQALEAFRASANQPGHFYADLYSLAQMQLTELGIKAVYCQRLCTFGDEHQFYSHRRDGVTGRMASFIGIISR